MVDGRSHRFELKKSRGRTRNDDDGDDDDGGDDDDDDDMALTSGRHGVRQGSTLPAAARRCRTLCGRRWRTAVHDIRARRHRAASNRIAPSATGTNREDDIWRS